eukprot:tig00021612_g22862.t1
MAPKKGKVAKLGESSDAAAAAGAEESAARAGQLQAPAEPVEVRVLADSRQNGGLTTTKATVTSDGSPTASRPAARQPIMPLGVWANPAFRAAMGSLRLPPLAGASASATTSPPIALVDIESAPFPAWDGEEFAHEARGLLARRMSGENAWGAMIGGARGPEHGCEAVTAYLTPRRIVLLGSAPFRLASIPLELIEREELAEGAGGAPRVTFVSTAEGAAGIWQLFPGGAERHGLQAAERLSRLYSLLLGCLYDARFPLGPARGDEDADSDAPRPYDSELEEGAGSEPASPSSIALSLPATPRSPASFPRDDEYDPVSGPPRGPRGPRPSHAGRRLKPLEGGWAAAAPPPEPRRSRHALSGHLTLSRELEILCALCADPAWQDALSPGHRIALNYS